MQIPSFSRKTKAILDQSSLDFTKDVVKKMVFNDAVTRRVTSADGVEIQHLSLPWGWFCDDKSSIDIVEALVEYFLVLVVPRLCMHSPFFFCVSIRSLRSVFDTNVVLRWKLTSLKDSSGMSMRKRSGHKKNALKDSSSSKNKRAAFFQTSFWEEVIDVCQRTPALTFISTKMMLLNWRNVGKKRGYQKLTSCLVAQSVVTITTMDLPFIRSVSL